MRLMYTQCAGFIMLVALTLLTAGTPGIGGTCSVCYTAVLVPTWTVSTYTVRWRMCVLRRACRSIGNWYIKGP